MFEILKEIIRIAIYGAILYFIYLVYIFIINPWRTKKRYSKFNNVGMCPLNSPIFQDILMSMQNERNNKFRFQHYYDMAIENPNIDLYFSQDATSSFYSVCSLKSISEFNKFIPEMIDRNDNSRSVLGSITPKSLGVLPSNKDWDERRKLATKTVGIGFASKYIPLMIQTVDNWAKNVKIGEKIDFTLELNRITFNIITKILFGRDIDKMEKCEYTSPHDGSVTLLNFDDAYFKYINDEFYACYS